MKTKFIPIESDILNDNRMSALINDMGATGYGIYMLLLIELRNHKNYCIDNQSLKLIMRKYNIKRPKIEAVLYEYDLFTIEKVEENNLSISSEYVTRVMRNYDLKIAEAKKNGKKGADIRWEKNDSDPITKEKKRREKKTSEEKEEKEEKETAAVAVVYGNKPVELQKQIGWKEYLQEALNDRIWVELQAKHSGLGMRFIKHKDDIVSMFMDHVLTHGKEYGLHSVGEVKYYFANFVRQATATNKRIVDELDRIEQEKKANSRYRFEDVDPTTGTRTYFGKYIPVEAPPRPNNNAIWIEELQQWM
ncbi:Lin1244/Lin1753 domain-containing protein [Bacteroides sp. 519]|uniref:Lin1244/Lin1753 domain-containing protein n=1 Tax=Bacteroides sp. 519 TaxID=2302937 RepID=UPI0013CF7185|nr:Lin1244/Lin1753 domain-containing protein [Bacteroides sp. 519]